MDRQLEEVEEEVRVSIVVEATVAVRQWVETGLVLESVRNVGQGGTRRPVYQLIQVEDYAPFGETGHVVVDHPTTRVPTTLWKVRHTLRE